MFTTSYSDTKWLSIAYSRFSESGSELGNTWLSVGYSLSLKARNTQSVQDFSFRFHLTMDALAVQLMVPTTKPIVDFHLQVASHVEQTRKNSEIAWIGNLTIEGLMKL